MREPDLLQMLRESLEAKRVKHHPSCGTTYMEDCECPSMTETTPPPDALLRVAVEALRQFEREQITLRGSHTDEETRIAARALLAKLGAAAGEPTDRCRCGAPCRKEVLERGGEHGWGDDASRTVLRYVPPLPAADAARVPDGLLARVKAAAQRIEDGHAIRRVPADPTDPDLVLAEIAAWLEGRPAPFWIARALTQQEGP